MTTTIEFIARFGITALTITGLIGYFGKKVFEHYLSLKVNSYKEELNKQSIEFKNKLEIINYEHQIKFSKLHADRAEIIKTIFKQITILEELVKSVTTTNQGTEWFETQTKEENASKHLIETRKNFEENKIYFHEELSNEIEYALKNSESYISESLGIKRQAKRESTNREYWKQMKEKEETASEKWQNLENHSHEELKRIRESLANKFRELFGVI